MRTRIPFPTNPRDLDFSVDRYSLLGYAVLTTPRTRRDRDSIRVHLTNGSQLGLLKHRKRFSPSDLPDYFVRNRAAKTIVGVANFLDDPTATKAMIMIEQDHGYSLLLKPHYSRNTDQPGTAADPDYYVLRPEIPLEQLLRYLKRLKVFPPKQQSY